MSARRLQLAEPEQRIPHSEMGMGKKFRVLQSLGQAKQLLNLFARRCQLAARQVDPAGRQHRAGPRRRVGAGLPAQRQRTRHDAFQIIGCHPSGCHQRSHHSDLKRELPLVALPALGQGVEHFYASPEMGDGFEIARTRGGPLAGALPICNRLVAAARLGEVMSKEFRLRVGNACEAGFELRGDLRVEVLPPPAQQARICYIA